MTIRCKFQCESVLVGERHEAPKLRAVYTGNPEDNTFAKASPSGELTLQIDNTEAHGFFIPGKKYYIDITEA